IRRGDAVGYGGRLALDRVAVVRDECAFAVGFHDWAAAAKVAPGEGAVQVGHLARPIVRIVVTVGFLGQDYPRGDITDGSADHLPDASEQGNGLGSIDDVRFVDIRGTVHDDVGPVFDSGRVGVEGVVVEAHRPLGAFHIPQPPAVGL